MDGCDTTFGSGHCRDPLRAAAVQGSQGRHRRQAEVAISETPRMTSETSSTMWLAGWL